MLGNMNLTIVEFGAAFELCNSTERKSRGRHFAVMTKSDETHELSWPWWAPWALLAVALTSLLTVGATLYDIL